MNRKEIIKKLNDLSKGGVSPWLKDAKRRAKNRYWHNRSRAIATSILTIMREKEISKEDICSKERIHPSTFKKIVKGEYNMNVKTIAKIERALGENIINTTWDTTIKK